jgi:hypothetical protein
VYELACDTHSGDGAVVAIARVSSYVDTYAQLFMQRAAQGVYIRIVVL